MVWQRQIIIYNQHLACMVVWNLHWFHISLISLQPVRQVHLPSINSGSQRGLILTQFNLRRPCESLYKKFPVVTFVSWKVVLQWDSNQHLCLEQVYHLLADLSSGDTSTPIYIQYTFLWAKTCISIRIQHFQNADNPVCLGVIPLQTIDFPADLTFCKSRALSNYLILESSFSKTWEKYIFIYVTF